MLGITERGESRERGSVGAERRECRALNWVASRNLWKTQTYLIFSVRRLNLRYGGQNDSLQCTSTRF